MPKLTADIHDITYLIVGLTAVGSYPEGVTRSEAVEKVTKAVNGWILQKALKYNLPRPRQVGEQYCKKVIKELDTLGLITKVNKKYRLTASGATIIELFHENKTDELRRKVLVLMLTAYYQIEQFLDRIYGLSPSGQIAIPVVSSALVRLHRHAPSLLAERYTSILAHYVPHLQQDSTILAKQLDQVLSKQALSSQKLEDLVQGVVDKYMLSLLFSDVVRNRRRFDVIVSRCTFLELVNSASVTLDTFPCLVVYLTSYICPPMAQPDYLRRGLEVELSPSKKIIINQVTYDFEGLSMFREALKQAYLLHKLSFGDARITDLRTEVCRRLRISDRQFDKLLVHLYRTEPGNISLGYSYERFTTKASGIAVEDEGAVFYNLARINY